MTKMLYVSDKHLPTDFQCVLSICQVNPFEGGNSEPVVFADDIDGFYSNAHKATSTPGKISK